LNVIFHPILPPTIMLAIEVRRTSYGLPLKHAV